MLVSPPPSSVGAPAAAGVTTAGATRTQISVAGAKLAGGELHLARQRTRRDSVTPSRCICSTNIAIVVPPPLLTACGDSLDGTIHDHCGETRAPIFVGTAEPTMPRDPKDSADVIQEPGCCRFASS